MQRVPSPARPRRLQPDLAVAFLAGLAALVAYLITLTPSVAPGDVAELQYIPFRLGIPHPNGFPLYLLLGKLWSFLPLGALAWRMNLLSAVFGALGVVALYALLRVSGLPRAASAGGALAWAFQRTYWAWSTVADRYSLVLFLAIASFAALLAWRRADEPRRLWLAALAQGCIWATHVAAPLYALPAAVLLLWPRRRLRGDDGGRRRVGARTWLVAAALFAAPILLYAYVPLRGSALWVPSAVDPVWAQPDAVLRGVIHPRFEPNATAILAYFRAGSPIDLARLLPDLVGRRADLLALFRAEVGLWWLLPAFAGLLIAVARNRAWGLALLLLLVADTVLAAQYWQGNVEAYFLPATLALTIGLAEAGGALQRLAARLNRRAVSALLAALLIALPALAVTRNAPPTRAESRALDSYWRDVLALPLERGAGLLAHWSDLTPLWYFQQAEGLRADAQGLYLPEIDRVESAVRQGQAVYLSGPLSGWYPDLAGRFTLAPWGPLVRLADPAQGATPAPALTVTFGDALGLAAVDLPREPAIPGATVTFSLTWRSLAPVSRDMHISFRIKEAGRTLAQQDDRVVTPWFPSPAVTPGLDFWSRHHLRVPLGLGPGEYELAAVVYDLGGPELRPSAGGGEVSLGSLRIGDEPAGAVRFSLTPTLGPCIRVETARPFALAATTGALLDFDLLVALRCQPAEDVTLRYFLAAEGREYPLQDAGAAVAWRGGGHQLLRAQVRVPADVAPGQYELRVAAADGSHGRLPARRIGPLPLPAQQPLGQVTVTARPFSTEVPALQQPLDAAFDNGMRLLGYERADVIGGSDAFTVTLAWRADRAIPQGYQLFIHLLDEDGAIAAQRDAPPGDLPTQAWLPGEVVAAAYALQPAAPLPPGEYRLIAGLYDPGAMQRALVSAPGKPPADHVELGAVRVEP